jgi:DNA replication protein DnaC
MKNRIRDIQSAYQMRRDRARYDQERRKNEIYDRVPQIRAIDEEISRTGLKLSKLVLYGQVDPEKAVKDLEEALKKLKNERAFLMTEHNFPLDYAELHYTCPLCSDTGHLPDGRLCKCYRQQLIEYAYDMSNLKGVLSRENFSTFDMSLFSDEPFKSEALTPRANMNEILSISEGFVHEFGNRYDNLLFYGATGLGKTFLCHAIAKSLLDKGHTVIYQTAFGLIKLLEKYTFSETGRSEAAEAYQMLFESDLLIIDDLGTEMVNTFTNTEIFNLINTRLLRQKPMILSTNLTPVQLRETYSERVASRLFGEFRFLYFYGKDLRWEV